MNTFSHRRQYRKQLLLQIQNDREQMEKSIVSLQNWSKKIRSLTATTSAVAAFAAAPTRLSPRSARPGKADWLVGLAAGTVTAWLVIRKRSAAMQAHTRR